MFCSRCGNQSQPNQRFCTKCGAPIGAAESAKAAAPVAPAPATQPVTQATSAVPQTPPFVPQPPPATPAPTPTAMTPIPDGGLTIEDVVAWIEKAGLTAKVVTAENGERHVVITIKNANTPFNIFMRDGNGERFASLDLAVGWSTHGSFKTSQLNEWNSTNRWCRAYFDDVNDPWLEMDIDLWPGGTYELLKDQFLVWLDTVARFIDKYGVK